MSETKELIDLFENATKECTTKGLNLTIYRGMGKENRKYVDTHAFFEFEDFRVEISAKIIIVELESSGGERNLTKYWYLIAHHHISKPVRLFHLYRQRGKYEHAQTFLVWDFLYEKMVQKLGKERIEATLHPFREIAEVQSVIEDFKNQIKDF